MLSVILEGVSKWILSGYSGAVFSYNHNIALWATALILIGRSLIWLCVAFYGASFGIKHLEKWPRLVIFFRWFNRAWNRAFEKVNFILDYIFGKDRITRKKINKETAGWLLKRKKWFVLALGFVPYLPVISTAVIVAVRIMKIRRGLLILMTASVFKSLLICFTFYHLLTL